MRISFARFAFYFLTSSVIFAGQANSQRSYESLNCASLGADAKDCSVCFKSTKDEGSTFGPIDSFTNFSNNHIVFFLDENEPNYSWKTLDNSKWKVSYNLLKYPDDLVIHTSESGRKYFYIEPNKNLSLAVPTSDNHGVTFMVGDSSSVDKPSFKFTFSRNYHKYTGEWGKGVISDDKVKYNSCIFYYKNE